MGKIPKHYKWTNCICLLLSCQRSLLVVCFQVQEMRLTLSLRYSHPIQNIILYLTEPDVTPIIHRNNFEQFLRSYDNILALTGAGVSTDSGLPDYRSEEGLFGKSNYKPVQYSQFLKCPDARRRFWARNYVGWPKFSSAEPNETHMFFVKLEIKQDKLLSIVTQNVDGLHHKAGSKNVVELHGNSFWVTCLGCKSKISRYDFQRTLAKLNPECRSFIDEVRPDGDVEISDDIVKNFVVPDCESCGGILKPTVVFFGDNVPQGRVKRIEQLVEKCDALLVMGTTLSTLSSLRIVNQAFDLCKFICVVNNGPTKGDKMADLLISTKFSNLIPRLRME